MLQVVEVLCTSLANGKGQRQGLQVSTAEEFNKWRSGVQSSRQDVAAERLQALQAVSDAAQEPQAVFVK